MPPNYIAMWKVWCLWWLGFDGTFAWPVTYLPNHNSGFRSPSSSLLWLLLFNLPTHLHNSWHIGPNCDVFCDHNTLIFFFGILHIYADTNWQSIIINLKVFWILGGYVCLITFWLTKMIILFLPEEWNYMPPKKSYWGREYKRTHVRPREIDT